MEATYLTIKEAARALGVSCATLRNWDKSGKFHARRHPVNNYRVYKEDDVNRLLQDMDGGNVHRIKIKKNQVVRLKVVSVKDTPDQQDNSL